MAKKAPPLYPDHPMYTDAVDAMRRYHSAVASGSSSEEIERLRQIAESQFQALNDYQLDALASHPRKAH
ncbi:hypothetical protein [Pseudomonas sp. RW3S2]|uniref:hypothetical protein n=1 Tax=Pseudomonas sp. RW3S2 TaxID=485884 RepID=UPI0016484A49|nr:hypothetical protein [Pseudomonas sp. RW3S2]MBC3421948.1 hypothetical protein [Pseudomonas sp. RW3S2]